MGLRCDHSCGSMVRFFFCRSFLPGRAKNDLQRVQNPWFAKALNAFAFCTVAHFTLGSLCAKQANALRITDPEALTAFCLSVTRAAIPDQSHPVFATYVAQRIQAHRGTLYVEKDAGLFVAVRG